jgi:hypothetical protein
MKIKEPFFILSAYDTRHGKRYNNTNHTALLHTLRGLGYDVAECTGCYAGVTEQSILVLDRVAAPHTERVLLSLARRYGQEAILTVDAGRRARLIPLDRWKAVEPVGTFTRTTKEKLTSGVGWTKCAGQYYVCV